MTREEIASYEQRQRFRLEARTLANMTKEAAIVIRELGLAASAKVLDDQAERVLRTLDAVLPEETPNVPRGA